MAQIEKTPRWASTLREGLELDLHTHAKAFRQALQRAQRRIGIAAFKLANVRLSDARLFS